MKTKGPEGFENYYREVFGSRWKDLKQSLLAKPRYKELKDGLVEPYFLDDASFIAACMLDVRDGDRVLDMCAAPGGKSLVLSGRMGETGTLQANDRSTARRIRLKTVLNRHLPEPVRKRVSISGRDAVSWCLREKNAYDRLLLDAPCSSERHVINSPYHLGKWSLSRIKRLSRQQYAMLVSALEVIRPGGTILYCTCALTPAENDGVIGRACAKRAGKIEILPIIVAQGEKTRYGWQIYPDICLGSGPMYVCKIKRVST
ncbi:RsmB/NOP family class I SAM-dependent RNA methyltransferase [Fibrobacterota bacterium]